MLPAFFKLDRSFLRQHLSTLLALAWAILTPAADSFAGDAAPSGDAMIRAPFGSSEIVVSTTSRLAGAIHSITWNGKEFIDSLDHGRQLQSACSFDITAEGGAETFNPTEAGSRLDGAEPHSTSRLLKISTTGNILATLTQMAFWLAPGERSEGQLARNAGTLSEHRLAKEVRIGASGLPNVLDYTATFLVPENEPHTAAQFEALTGYMPPEFERFWGFVRATRKLEPLSDGPGEQSEPVVFSTSDGSHAMGILSLETPQAGTTGPTYGRFRFVAERVVKWNCVFRVRSGVVPGEYRYRMLVPIGTLADVETALRALDAEH